MKLGRFYFGYNAITDNGRRQSHKTRIYHEEEVATKHKRKKLVATAQEQMRNHALVAWMVRKHLDYVSKFHFSFRSGKPEVDTLVNRIFKWHGSPRNLDHLGRFGRDEMFRLFEMEKVLSGDAGLLKLEGLKLQAIESDLIAKGAIAENATEQQRKEITTVNDSGLVKDEEGRVQAYAVCQRGKNGGDPIFDHLEPVDNLIFDGYWTRFSSQLRGISPLTTAINTVQDIHEAFEFNLIKAKMHALFGVALTREAPAGGDMGFASGAAQSRAWTATAYTWTAGDYCTYGNKIYYCNETHSTTTSSVFATDLAAGYWTQDTDGSGLDIDPRSINLIDLPQGSDVKVIESGTPSAEFVEGSYLFIQIAMLALDIPITCFDSRRSSFSARIADLNEYEVSNDYKRTKNRYVRQDYSDWLLASIWNSPDTAWPLRQVATAAGMKLRDVQEEVEWVASGSPWLDKYKQIQGDELGIAIGLDNAIDACRRRGANVFENIDKQSEVIKYAQEKGVPLVIGKTTEKTINEIVREEMTDAATDTEE